MLAHLRRPFLVMRTLGSFNHPGPMKKPIAISLQSSPQGFGWARSDDQLARPGWPPGSGRSSRNVPKLTDRANTRVGKGAGTTVRQPQTVVRRAHAGLANRVGTAHDRSLGWRDRATAFVHPTSRSPLRASSLLAKRTHQEKSLSRFSI